MMKSEKIEPLKVLAQKFPNYVWFFIGLLIASFFQFLFWPITKEMKNRGYSIIDFELAWKKATMDRILLAWDGMLDDALRMTLLDFGFIIGYVIILLSLLSLVNRFRKASSGIKYYDYVQISIIIAAMADVVENIFAIYILSFPHSYVGISVFLMSLVSTIKWVIIAVTILIIFEGIIKGLIEKMKLG